MRPGILSQMATILITLATLTGTGCGGDNGGGPAGVPRARIASDIEKGGELKITVTIPPGHHAYLDRGREGNLLPVTFYWEDLIRSGVLKAKPRTRQSPPGEEYPTAGARVLRGSGAYVFENPNGRWPTGAKLRIRTQICDEVKGFCYPPRFHVLKL